MNAYISVTYVPSVCFSFFYEIVDKYRPHKVFEEYTSYILSIRPSVYDTICNNGW